MGYVGPADATSIIMDGLKRLEYRGYDSAGIAVNDGRIKGISAALPDRPCGRCCSGELGGPADSAPHRALRGSEEEAELRRSYQGRSGSPPG